MKRFLLGAILVLLLSVGGYLAYQNYLLSQRVPVEVINVIKTPTFVESMTPAAKAGNDIYGQVGQKISDIRASIGTQPIDPQEKEKAIATLDSFTGNYTEAIAAMEKSCSPETCKKNSITIKKSGFNVRIGEKESEYDGASDFTLKFNQTAIDDGSDRSEISAYKNLFYRVRATKKGYLDDIFTINNTEKLGDGNSEFFEFMPTFYKYDATLKIDASKKFTASTPNYTYTGEGNNFIMPDGSPAKGEIEIFFFDIAPEETFMSRSNLLNLDTFEQDSTFAGTGMMTYGMPFVRAYSGDTELRIKKPIQGTGVIVVAGQLMALPDMTYIPKNTDIDVKKATELGLPPFWRLDLDKGVWEGSTFQLLDATGKYSFLFY